MPCECSQVQAQTEGERSTLRIALRLNAMMFVIGMSAGWWAQSSGLLADALDMLADASTYGLALLAVTRSGKFKRNAALWSGALLLVLGLGIVLDVVRRGVLGSDPHGAAMMVFAAVSFIINVIVLRMLGKFRHGEVHLRATWLFTRVDVLANLGVFISGMAVWLTGYREADLVIGFAIGVWVIKEAIGILGESIPQASPCKSI